MIRNRGVPEAGTWVLVPLLSVWPSDGKILATGNQNARFVGQDIRSLKDSKGKTFGLDIYAAGQKKADGRITNSVMSLSGRPATKHPLRR